ncbi:MULTISPECIES: hypothetical protein [unclassified Devosia]|uniref:hypothetical protein n=1 Tax=unclassified Devosia TaxID=196773 RepID=UPI001554E458|nr:MULTISPECIES: hypothetical protein [unclassified Devosia]
MLRIVVLAASLCLTTWPVAAAEKEIAIVAQFLSPDGEQRIELTFGRPGLSLADCRRDYYASLRSIKSQMANGFVHPNLRRFTYVDGSCQDVTGQGRGSPAVR